jgi:hypothetical protein
MKYVWHDFILRVTCSEQKLYVTKRNKRGILKMRNPAKNVIFFLAALLVGSVAASAQTARTAQPANMPKTIPMQQGPNGSHPDLSGVWVSAVGAGLGRDARPKGLPITPENDETDDYVFRHTPYPEQAWAKEKFEYNRDPGNPFTQGRNELSPYLAKCSPQGPTVDWQFGSWPFELIQTPKRLLMISERNHEVRQFWTDGREHPKDFGHNWFGHSIGHWEGNSLVTDTIGLNDQTWFDKAGHVHSDQLHLIEKLTRVEPGKLLLNLTFDDPKTFTQQWTAFRYFYLRPNWDLEEEILCEDKFLGKEIPLR